MRHFYFIICSFILTTTQAQTSQDTMYVWKTGQLVIKQSIKPADIDSITFRRPYENLNSVIICSQRWTTSNYESTTYRDGTPIPQVTDPIAWGNLTTGAWCYYNNETANGSVYGKLYNWYAVAGIYDSASLNNPSLRKQFAPVGWHIPSDAEWTTLINCLGGQPIAGGKMKETGTLHWDSPNTGATNSSGFTGLPGGSRDFNGTFYALRCYGDFWSRTEISSSDAWFRNLNCGNSSASAGGDNKKYGFSVRFIRD